MIDQLHFLRPLWLLALIPLVLCLIWLHRGRRITGAWQVSDRNECDFVDRVHFDDHYDKVLCFRTDLAILYRTVFVVLRGTGY